jgi:protein-disulfide isomerase
MTTRSSAASRARPSAGRPGPRSQRSIFDRISLPVLTVIALAAGLVVVIVAALITGGSPGVDIRQPRSDLAGLTVDGRTMGVADAPVTVEVWADFQCPACGLLAREVEPLALRPLVEQGKVRVTYRDLAFLGEESLAAAVGGRFAAEQGRFWRYHDLVFANQDGENQGAFRTERLVAIAEAAGLDPEAFRRALTDPDLRAAVTAETSQGHALGVTSTPTLVIDGVAYPGVPDPDALVAYLEELAG